MINKEHAILNNLYVAVVEAIEYENITISTTNSDEMIAAIRKATEAYVTAALAKRGGSCAFNAAMKEYENVMPGSERLNYSSEAEILRKHLNITMTKQEILNLTALMHAAFTAAFYEVEFAMDDRAYEVAQSICRRISPNRDSTSEYKGLLDEYANAFTHATGAELLDQGLEKYNDND